MVCRTLKVTFVKYILKNTPAHHAHRGNYASPVGTTNATSRLVRKSTLLQGFTIVELLVALAIASILLTVVAPGLRTFVNSNELVGVTNDFVGQLSLTRSEALKRKANAIICKSGGGTTCVTTGTWDSGWIMFADIDGSGGWTAGDVVFRSYTPDSSHTTLTASSDKIVFDRNGKTGASSTFTFCNSIIGKARKISMNQFGRHTLSQEAC